MGEQAWLRIRKYLEEEDLEAAEGAQEPVKARTFFFEIVHLPSSST